MDLKQFYIVFFNKNFSEIVPQNWIIDKTLRFPKKAFKIKNAHEMLPQEDWHSYEIEKQFGPYGKLFYLCYFKTNV